jgi:hypothetical protein
MEILKLTKENRELFVESNPYHYGLAAEFGWIREVIVLETPIILNSAEEIN